MPYRRANYNFVVDSSFQPFSMQELMTPFLMYKDAFEKQEAAYNELAKETDTFKYLEEYAKEHPESEAAQIYNNYANEMHKQFSDFSQHGLSMSNRRALTNLKRRFEGEIGVLKRADTKLQEILKTRNAARAAGKSILYANENPTLDDLLYTDNDFNHYGIDTEDLRKEAAQYAQAASSRIYGNTRIQDINKYFQNIIQTQGYSPEVLNAWRQNLQSIPEFNQAIEDIKAARGIDNLTGANKERATQTIINGIMEGAAYQEARSVKDNPGVLTAPQEASNALARERLDLSALSNGNVKKDGKWVKSPTATAYTVTNSGNPVYLDEKKRPYALGSDGKTKYYDNDRDGNYTDRNPFTKPAKQDKEKTQEEILKERQGILQRTGGTGIMAARKGGSWISATTDNEFEDAGTYIPVIDNIWGTRSKLIDWGGDWNLTAKASGNYRYIGDATKLPIEAIKAINESLPPKANIEDYDVYGVRSRNDGDLRDDEKYDYVLWPKGQPFPYNQAESGNSSSSSETSSGSNGANEKPKKSK